MGRINKIVIMQLKNN